MPSTVDQNPLPHSVFHYTNSVAALRGIVINRELWLSLATDLNDPMEMRHGIAIAAERLREIPGAPSWDPHRSVTYSATPGSNYYLASFSAAGDNLSQWRGYASDGWCLQFSTSGLQKVLDRHRGGPSTSSPLEYVRYERGPQIDLLDDWLDACTETILECQQYPQHSSDGQHSPHEYHTGQRIWHLRGGLTSRLRRPAALMKGMAWSDEREIRLLVDLPSFDIRTSKAAQKVTGFRQFRTGSPEEGRTRAALTLEADGAPFPLLRIIAAPGTSADKRTPADRVAMARDALHEAGLPGIPVEESAIAVNGPLVSPPDWPWPAGEPENTKSTEEQP